MKGYCWLNQYIGGPAWVVQVAKFTPEKYGSFFKAFEAGPLAGCPCTPLSSSTTSGKYLNLDCLSSARDSALAWMDAIGMDKATARGPKAECDDRFRVPSGSLPSGAHCPYTCNMLEERAYTSNLYNDHGTDVKLIKFEIFPRLSPEVKTGVKSGYTRIRRLRMLLSHTFQDWQTIVDQTMARYGELLERITSTGEDVSQGRWWEAQERGRGSRTVLADVVRRLVGA